MAGKKWIQEAIAPSSKGALRRKLGVKKGATIPTDKLESVAKNSKNAKTKKQANLALTLKKLRKK